MIILVLFFFLFCTDDVLAQRVKVADAVVVTKIRDTHTAVWRATEDGTLTTSGLTLAEYDALVAVDAAPPSKQNLPANRTWTFVSASKNDEYSTASGLLEAGNVYTVDDTVHVILGANDEPLRLDKNAYAITDTGGKTLKIVPDPPGFEIANGEVHKK